MSKELNQAYAEGRSAGTGIMKGCVGASRYFGEGGQYFLDRAGNIAAFLGIGMKEFLRILTDFHRERLDAEPDLTVYPEIRGVRDRLLQRYRGMADAGMSEELIAVHESLDFWRDYRMRRQYGKVFVPKVTADNAGRERCRAVYMPESDRGPLHFKNVDDPISGWIPKPPVRETPVWPFSPLFMDGVGSGLHIDEDAVEIFPADPRSLCRKHCSTVGEVREFMVRYNYFWGSANILVHDDKGNSVAFDKASRNRIAVREPGPDGISYINGMSSFEADYEAFIIGQRRLYLQETGQPETSVEACYFRFCEGVLKNMKRRLADLTKRPEMDALIAMMSSRDPDGPLCKSGRKVHPDERESGYTLIQSLYLLSEKKELRRQWRGNTPVWEDPWEEIVYR